MQRTLICVAWSNGRWRVSESGPRNSIACFGEWQDAMDYSRDLAARTQDSSLLVVRNEQEPEAETDAGPRHVRARMAAPARRYTFRT